MSKLKEMWYSISERKRMVVLFFVQVWTWPQLFFATMSPEIGIPLSITMVCGILYNVVCIVEASDD